MTTAEKMRAKIECPKGRVVLVPVPRCPVCKMQVDIYGLHLSTTTCTSSVLAEPTPPTKGANHD